MSVRDIRAHLAELYGVQVSGDLISRVLDGVLDELRAWQSRPLESVAGQRGDELICAGAWRAAAEAPPASVAKVEAGRGRGRGAWGRAPPRREVVSACRRRC